MKKLPRHTTRCLGVFVSVLGYAAIFLPHGALTLVCPHFARTWRSGAGSCIVRRSAGHAEVAVPPLVHLGNPDLMRPQPAIPVQDVTSGEMRARLATLKAAMTEHGGIGIAAPQIGWWARAMCFGVEQGNPRYAKAAPVPFQMWINPKVTWASAETNWLWEGCLSVPGLRGWVERPRDVRMEGLDEFGKTRIANLTGLPARIAQHELDHLDGVLFPQRVASASFLVPQVTMDIQRDWPVDWPSPGSNQAGPGVLSTEM